MSVGSEFHRSDAATGKERRPTVVSRNGGTSSCCDDEERSRWRPGRSETRTSCSSSELSDTDTHPLMDTAGDA